MAHFFYIAEINTTLYTNYTLVLKNKNKDLPKSGNFTYTCFKFLFKIFLFCLILPFTYPSISTAAAAKSLQSCPALCNPIDSSPPDSSVPGILQARILECVAISFSNQSIHVCLKCDYVQNKDLDKIQGKVLTALSSQKGLWKDLTVRTGTPTQCHLAAWMRGEYAEERIHPPETITTLLLAIL